MILIIDNYDSFTYNFHQYLRELGAETQVRRNDSLTAAAALELNPAGIVISPGSGLAQEAGIALELVREAGGKLPILGVDLGLFVIAAAFDAPIAPAPKVMHGKVSEITHDNSGLFAGLGTRPFKAMRYHSHSLVRDQLPPELAVTATADDGEIMAITHRDHPIYGLQFHPESIMTPMGKRILRNFINVTGGNS